MSNPGPNVTQTSMINKDNIPPDGYQFGTTAAQLLSFWGAAPSAQPASPAGNVHTVAAGSTTGVFVNTSFDGGVGSTAYTIGDVVLALKSIGLLAK